MADLAAGLQELKPHYRSGTDDLRGDFFVPCLSICSRYRRGAGYFSSEALASWGDALPNVLRLSSGAIQLLIAPILSDPDREALRAAIGERRDRLLAEAVDSLVLEATGADNGGRGSRLLAWLVAHGIIEIRFAVPTGADLVGIYHEKIGVIDFENGIQLAFTGSANETGAGYASNYETLDVYRSWIQEDRERVGYKVSQFEDAWSDRAPGLTVLPLSARALERIRSFASDHPPREAQETEDIDSRRWRHQDEAVAAFLREERGVLQMATGTGKTRTALRIIRDLLDSGEIDSVIVAADGTDLLDQWALELLQVATDQSPSLTLLRHYQAHHDVDRYVNSPGRKILLVSRPSLGAALRQLDDPRKLLLIHDEVHRLGSPSNREQLKGRSMEIRWRLGLSATPEREYDEAGTDFIREHVGPVIYEFDLAQAIERRVLCPFNYHPLPYETTQDDRDRIASVYKKKAARAGDGRPMSDAEVWTELAKVHKTSLGKLEPFGRFVRDNPDILTRSIVFVETKAYGELILPLIHQVHPEFHTYFDQDDKGVLRRFARGDLECLVTCHRLSEGIDIRSLRNVMLVSSARARLETIQRIGRCLRWDPNDPLKTANVVDFVRDYDSPEPNSDHHRATWLESLAQIRP